MDEIRIVDTTLRDGDISLWAYGMTTGMMLPALRHMDRAGLRFHGIFLSLRFKNSCASTRRSVGLAAAWHKEESRKHACALSRRVA